MKNVLSTGITSSSQQPYTKTTHEWYNAMSKDVAEAFVKSLIPSSAYTGKLVILSGCALTGTNPGTRTVSGGWVWYNGEIFRVNAGTFTTGVGEIGVWSINTSSTNLTFSDNASKPVHQERTFVITNGTSGSGLFDEGEEFYFGKWIENDFTVSDFSFLGADNIEQKTWHRRVGYIVEFSIRVVLEITDYTLWQSYGDSGQISSYALATSEIQSIAYGSVGSKMIGYGVPSSDQNDLSFGNVSVEYSLGSSDQTRFRLIVYIPKTLINTELLVLEANGFYQI